MRLFYSYAMGRDDREPSWAQRIRAIRKDLQLGELEDSAVVAPGLFFHLVRYSPDVVVLEDLGGLPNSLVAALYCRAWKKPYLIWGLGHVPEKQRSPLRRALAPAIRFLYAGAFGFLCYSKHAADVYGQYAKPTYVAPNAYLPRPPEDEVARLTKLIGTRYETQNFRVVSIGTFKKQKRYEVLIEAVARTAARVALDLIGDGPETTELRALARRLGIADRVRFHGPIYDSAQKALLLSSAHIGVIPGRGGLAIQEMMAHGIPVISGVADGTERDLVRDGETGYLLAGFPSAEQIATTLDRFVALTTQEQTAMARGALDTVVHESNVDVMAEEFSRAIRDAVRS
jgi:glycosyltransferase involved in cell wall biosynthesis